jgi:hypothetical protein
VSNNKQQGTQMSLYSIRNLAISLLSDDRGISKESYDLLLDLLEGDDDITNHVEATDDAFYLPTGWKGDDSLPGFGYLEKKVHALIPTASLEKDNDEQIVVYTGLKTSHSGYGGAVIEV